MADNLSRTLLAEHLVAGDLDAGGEIALRIDQVLVHDAAGPLCALQLDAMGIRSARPPLAVAYADHLLGENDNRNADDHLLLRSAAGRFGMWFSPPGNGVSHPVHQQRFGVPGATLLGTDSHTPAAGALGMLGVGAGGIAVSLVITGEPLRLRMPEIWGVRLTGELSPWVSAKDVILELLRRHGIGGATGRIIEYHGPGVATLSVMDRHVIANMGTEMGATSSVFPSDDHTRTYLAHQGRQDAWRPLTADDGAHYDHHDDVDLTTVIPLIALPSSPGNVVPVQQVAGEPIQQAYVGSSANPGFRDIAVVADILGDDRVAQGLSLDVNPASRQALRQLIDDGRLARLIRAGARLHQTGCNGCIGMGQAPATGRRSLRTVPRNFPGRSGSPQDQVYLCSPETAAASALTGVITDPRSLSRQWTAIAEPNAPDGDADLLHPPPPNDAPPTELIKGPAHTELPAYEPIGDEVDLPVALIAGDDVSTDEIMPAGSAGLSVWSSLNAMSDMCFQRIDDDYPRRVRDHDGGHVVVGGANYGQGSSREQAALVPRNLGMRAVLAKSISRIHGENLAYYGVLPLIFDDPADYERLELGSVVRLRGIHDALDSDRDRLEADYEGGSMTLRYTLSPHQRRVLRAGGLISWRRAQTDAGRGTTPESAN